MHHASERVQAFSIHFGISAIAFLSLLYVVLLYWYPGPHFSLNGGWQGIRIVLPVLFILGPCLTLLVFSPEKSLRAKAFDLTCIGILQIGAFGWGIYALHTQRPVGVSLSEGIIYPVVEEELLLQKKTAADMKLLDDGRPPVVFARAAATEEEQMEVVAYDFMQGLPVARLFFLFDPIRLHVDELYAASLDNVHPVPEGFLPVRDAYLDKYRYHAGELAFVPFAGRYGRTVLVFNRSARVIGSIAEPRYDD